MGITSVLSFPPSADPQAEASPARPTGSAPQPVPGTGSSAESGGLQGQGSAPGAVEDAVKVQWEPPGEIPVYQFLDQHGTLVLQVPPQQVLELASEISQELAQEETPKKVIGDKGGEDNGS